MDPTIFLSRFCLSLFLFASYSFASSINPASTPVVTPASLGFLVPNPEPIFPSGVDTYSPPYIATVTTGPQIAEILRTAGADETFTLSGNRFLNGLTKFDLFSQTSESDWSLHSVDPILTSAQTASVTVPADVDPWSMYLVWPNNEGVRGKPFALNRTEGWWIGPHNAIVGQTISIYGRNLAKNNGTATSFVYIKPQNSSGVWVMPTSVNPYKVDIVVPSLTPGDYEVWIHNGHGADFGWSGPLAFTVLSQSPWANLGARTYDVTTYGAVGNGVTDDGAAIEAAFAAAAANTPATVYFPAGTYAVQRVLYVPGHVRLLGDGRDSSEIKLTVPVSTLPTVNFIENGGEGNLYEDIEINGDGMLSGGALMYVAAYDLKMVNARLNSRGSSTLDVNGVSRNMVFENVDVIGTGSFFGSSTQIFINSSTFRMTNDGESAVAFWGGNGLSMTNNHLYNYDEGSSDGHGIGRIFMAQGHFGSLRNTYFSGNETHNSAPRDCNLVDCNKGEQILFEFGSGEYHDDLIAVSADSVTFSSVAVDPSLYAGGKDIVIISGQGVGQHRHILSVNSGMVTVDRNWNILPDSTSRFLISSIAQQSVIYQNIFQGRTTHSTHDSASTAVNIFGNSFDIIVDDNEISRMRHGMMVVTHTSDSEEYASPLYFNLISNNQISDGANGFYTGHVYGYDSAPIFGAIGNVFRNNTIDNMSRVGIIIDQWDSTGGDIDSQVFEKNVISDLPYGLISGLKVIWTYDGNFSPAPTDGTHLTGTILRQNYFDRGTASFSGSIGFRSEPFNTWVNQDSTWTGFETGNPLLLTK